MMSTESLQPPAPPPAPSGFWLRRRIVACPTWRLWLCLSLTGLALVMVLGGGVHRWLALNEPVPDAPYLIVEGWVPDYVLAAAVTVADDTAATRVFCSGLPVEKGHYLLTMKNFAEISSRTLALLGLDPARICPVPCPGVKTERTRTMATALKAVLDKEPVPDNGRKINLITLGTHARRSRAIYEEVLGPAWQVGVYSIADESYEAPQWFRQSSGVRNVISELSALSLKAVGGN